MLTFTNDGPKWFRPELGKDLGEAVVNRVSFFGVKEKDTGNCYIEVIEDGDTLFSFQVTEECMTAFLEGTY